MKMDRRVFRGGFTLTELLVVVVIIGVLASAIIPRLAGQRGKAEAAEALNVLGALKRAEYQYHDEQGDWYPFANTYCGVPDSLAVIRNKLGIELPPACPKWKYSVANVEGNLSVIATSPNGSYIFQNLEGNVDTWQGEGDYLTETGKYWPYIS